MKDDLGNRIKSNYEDRYRFNLPRRTYTIIRLDGKAFHSYTKNLKKPFDYDLANDIDAAVISIMSEIQGAAFAYCQSDEISILLTDFAKPNTDAWFDGNIQKMASISASLMTAEFNLLRIKRSQGSYFHPNNLPNLAYFDSRIFTIPDRTEVMNYFIWRNQDCARNSISMVAQSLFSHKELHNKNSNEKQEMIFQKSGKNWADYPEADKNGRLILKETYNLNNAIRHKWVSNPAWKFTQDKEKLLDLIPKYE